jgi:hypothetical protein
MKSAEEEFAALLLGRGKALSRDKRSLDIRQVSEAYVNVQYFLLSSSLENWQSDG